MASRSRAAILTLVLLACIGIAIAGGGTEANNTEHSVSAITNLREIR